MPTYDVFDEDRYFEKAESIRLIHFGGRALGLSICEDAWNSEDFWSRPLYPIDPIRNQIEKGANLLVNISASPYEIGKPLFRFRMLQDHVRKHKTPLIYVNLVGGKDDLLFDGTSLAIGKTGNVIAQGHRFAEDLLTIGFAFRTERPRNLHFPNGRDIVSFLRLLCIIEQNRHVFDISVNTR